MCLILIANRFTPRYPLIIAANRDEFYRRETAPLSRWTSHPQVYGGRDLANGGTWMGVTTSGRFAAVTNYRDPKNLRPNAPSRGMLVSSFLTGNETPTNYAAKLESEGHLYNGFNLLFGGKESLVWYSNRGPKPMVIESGIFGLGNALFDTPWPKVQKAKTGFQKVLRENDAPLEQNILEFLEDPTQFPDDELPDTGVGQEWERILSPIFIKSPNYGTRSSSVLLFEHTGAITFIEQTFERGEKTSPPVRFEIKIS